MILVAVGVVLGVLLGLAAYVGRYSDKEVRQSHAGAFAKAQAQSKDSAVERWLIGLAAPLSGTQYTNPPEESPTYRSIRLKLVAAGGMFAGSVNVFLSVQVAAILLGLLMLLFALLANTGILSLALAILGIGMAAWPWQKVNSVAKKRSEKVDASLPEFAELLLMPLTSGYGVLPSLAFTAERVPGPVSREVEIMLQAVSSRTVTEEEGFEQAGERLGTPAARAFFRALAQSQRDGTPAAEVIAGQAKQLRKMAYENTRAKIKVLPNKLVVIMGIHVMPTLFIIVLVPTFAGITAGLGAG